MMGRWTFIGAGLLVLSLLLSPQHKGLAEERYTVKPGDSLYKISKSFGVSIEVLKKTNHLDGKAIQPKQVLLIPTQIPSTTLKVGQILTFQKTKKGEGTEERGGSEESTLEGLAEGNIDRQETAEPLGKWSNPEERNLFVRVVKNFLGIPYRLGGSTLKGIDCSAFVKKIYEIFNVHLPRTAREQFRIGKKVGKEELEEGDLVFFKTQRLNNAHVGIYIGNNEFVHASTHNKEVRVDHLDAPYFYKRFLKGVRVKELEKET